MNDENIFLYDEYGKAKYIAPGWHIYSHRAGCWVFMICSSCKYMINTNELVKGMIICSKGLKPKKGICISWKFWKFVN